MLATLCLQLKYRNNCPTVSQRFLGIPIQWMSSSSREWRRGVSPRFHLIVLCLVWIKRIRRQREFKILLCNPSGGNLLLRQSHMYNPVKHQWWSSFAKTANVITPRLLPQKSPTTDVRQDYRGAVNVGCR